MSRVSSRMLSIPFIAILLSLFATSALAQVTSEATQQIGWKLDAIRDGSPSSTYAQYYQTQNGGPGAGSDGVVYQYYYGPAGHGAIYYSPEHGAHIVFGAIEAAYRNQGFEARFGAPGNDPSYGPGGGCMNADVVRWQRFTKTVRSGSRIIFTTRHICERANGSTYLGVTFS